MKTFVINLEKDIERRKSIVEQMQNLLIPFEFFKGYYAKEMSKEDIALHYDRKTTIRNISLELVPAQIGCALSHLMVYKKIIDEDIVFTCIFEDDVVLPAGIKENINEIILKMRVDRPQIVLLSPVKTNGKIYSKHQGFNVEKFSSGFFTSAYIMNQAAAKVLYNKLYPVCHVADCWSYVKKHGYVEILATNPGLVEQDQITFGSSTNADLNALNVNDIAKTMKYKFHRAFWLTLDSIKGFYNRNFNKYKVQNKI